MLVMDVKYTGQNKGMTKFTKQDKNSEIIMLTKVTIIFLNKYSTKSCRTINFMHIKKTFLYSILQHVRKVARNKFMGIFITTF